MPDASPVKTARIGNLRLESGQLLKDVELAYVAVGELAPDGANAVLVTHGFTSGPSMLLHMPGTAEGSWAAMVGPGLPLDTDRFYIVCVNMLGSAYGSTGPTSIDPDTGRPYGADFPDITVGDMVAAQWKLLQILGVQRLRAVIGSSYGGLLAQQWALDKPTHVAAVAVVVSGPRFPASMSVEGLRARLAQSPGWNDGRYAYGAMHATLRAMRIDTLRNYSFLTLLEDRLQNADHAQAALETAADQWARAFDANALLTLTKAATAFDATNRYGDIRAKMLYVISKNDPLFPPNPETLQLLSRLPQGSSQYRYVEIDSRYGHLASGVDHALWSSALVNLLED